MRRSHVEVALGLTVVAAVAAAALVHEGSDSSDTSAPPSPRATATAFGQAYMEYLSGGFKAQALPAAAPQVQSVLAGAPPIPAASRHGSVALAGVRLTYVSGSSSAKAALLGRDSKHSYPVTIELRYAGNAWQVADLIPPDLPEILAPVLSKPTTPVAVHGAAKDFALAYAAFRSGATHTLPSGTATLRRQIQAGQDPLAGEPATGARVRLKSLDFGPDVNDVVAVAAVVSQGGHSRRFSFDVQLSAGRWQALGFPEAGQ
jgi:hypothetical protein